MGISLKELIILSLLVTVLIVQELALSYIPGLQFSTLLIVVYAKVFKIKKSLLLVFVYVILDILLTPQIMGSSMNLLFAPFMYVAWSLLVIVVNVFDKRCNVYVLALIGFLFGFVYSWILIYPNLILFKVDFWTYLVADILFEVLFAVSNLITIIWLFQPLYQFLKKEVSDEL